MRLIDADKITFFNCLAKTGNAVCCHAEGIVSKSAIEMQPTVKVIPVEWIEKYLNRLEIISKDNIGLGEEGCYNEIITIESMLSTWEKENEMR